MADVTLDRTEGVAVLTLNAPERRNALQPAMAREIEGAVGDLEGDPAVGALVVRGAEGVFCAGGDRDVLDHVGEDPAESTRYADLDAIYRSFHRIGQAAVPTVAAVRGTAVGAGVNLMLAADVRIVADDARILAGFLRIGVHPGGGHFVLAGRLAGPETAAALAIFGEEINGRQAESLGLAWMSVPDEEVESRAMGLATRAARDPELARMATRTMRRALGPPILPWSVAIEAERAPQMWSMRRKADG